jgi:protein SCO1/2
MSMTRITKSRLLLSAVFVGLVACASFVFVKTSAQSQFPVTTIGGPFALADQDGKTVTDRDLKGRPFLIFFGYTNCPDVCPTTLFELSEVLGVLGADADKLPIFFVSVDPGRDTPAILKDYLSGFDPHLRGLTGSPESLANIEKAYRVYTKRVDLPGGGYVMDHSVTIYLMDKNGQFVGPFNLKRTKEQAANELRRYL